MVLAKYDIRGIQAYVFRTDKLAEIRNVSDLPEKIIGSAIDEISREFPGQAPDIYDKKGGNALVTFENEEIFRKFSKRMAFYILKETYSLRLVYACVECTDDFYSDYEKLNKKLGALKSEMPEPAHTGAFPLCRQDYVTGFPVSEKKYMDNKTFFFTEESVLKRKQYKSSDDESRFIDDYIKEKGVDSHIAVIHIDGNSMGNRINEIIRGAGYRDVKDIFGRIRVKDSFKEVCDLTKAYTAEYRDLTNEKKPLVYSVIQAGDDITYITRAEIALSFTKLFLRLVSEKDMYDAGEHEKYGISACAGIAFIKSHFPFSDAYELAERLCASAKKRAKSMKNGENVGSWIDFELCGHIRDTDISKNRKKYGTADNGSTALHLRPYCLSSPLCGNEFFDYEKFEKKMTDLHNKDFLNRSRAKALRQAYYDGTAAVQNFNAAALSRGYDIGELYLSDETGKYAAYYDPIDIMDMFDMEFNKFVNEKLDVRGDEQ